MLNPGQTIVDTSDQTVVYALSKRLQLMYPHKFGQGKNFPMFGGIHIDKLLLEIHGQLIAGSDFLDFLTIQNFQSLVLKIALNVPKITSARYLIQVCLCTEFLA